MPYQNVKRYCDTTILRCSSQYLHAHNKKKRARCQEPIFIRWVRFTCGTKTCQDRVCMNFLSEDLQALCGAPIIKHELFRRPSTRNSSVLACEARLSSFDWRKH